MDRDATGRTLLTDNTSIVTQPGNEVVMPSAPVLALSRLRLGLIVCSAISALLVPSPVSSATAGCWGTTPAPTNSDPGSTIVADTFESGDFRHWTSVSVGGDASAAVVYGVYIDGRCSAKLHVTTNWPSRAFVSRSIGWSAHDVWATAWFKVTTAGVSGSNVPYFRFWSGSARIVDIFRSNNSGYLWLRTNDGAGGWRYVSLGRYISLATWYQLKLHARPNWSSSGVEVWLNGTRLYSNWTTYLPTSSLTSVMLGSEHADQKMDEYIDDVVVKAS